MRLGTYIVLALAAWPGVSIAASSQPMTKTFDAPRDTVYAAMVQAVGTTLKSAVKEACTVNFTSSDGYTIWLGHIVCQEAGNGKTVVNISVQLSRGSKQVFFTGSAKDKLVGTLWGNIDQNLKAGPTNATTKQEQVNTNAIGELGTVAIETTPDGAEVSTDGKFSGNSPASLRLPAGEHSIRIASPGFRIWERTITVTAGGTATIKAVLEREQ